MSYKYRSSSKGLPPAAATASPPTTTQGEAATATARATTFESIYHHPDFSDNENADEEEEEEEEDYSETDDDEEEDEDKDEEEEEEQQRERQSEEQTKMGTRRKSNLQSLDQKKPAAATTTTTTESKSQQTKKKKKRDPRGKYRGGAYSVAQQYSADVRRVEQTLLKAVGDYAAMIHPNFPTTNSTNIPRHRVCLVITNEIPIQKGQDGRFSKVKERTKRLQTEMTIVGNTMNDEIINFTHDIRNNPITQTILDAMENPHNYEIHSLLHNNQNHIHTQLQLYFQQQQKEREVLIANAKAAAIAASVAQFNNNNNNSTTPATTTTTSTVTGDNKSTSSPPNQWGKNMHQHEYDEVEMDNSRRPAKRPRHHGLATATTTAVMDPPSTTTTAAAAAVTRTVVDPPPSHSSLPYPEQVTLLEMKLLDKNTTPPLEKNTATTTPTSPPILIERLRRLEFHCFGHWSIQTSISQRLETLWKFV